MVVKKAGGRGRAQSCNFPPDSCRSQIEEIMVLKISFLPTNFSLKGQNATFSVLNFVLLEENIQTKIYFWRAKI